MIYLYKCKCGEKSEKSLSLAEFRKTIPCSCGKDMTIDIAAQQGGMKDTASNWPMESDACGVHPDQAKEYAKYLREKGVPTEVLPNGNPVFTGRDHRKKVCAVTGMYDRNAGYGDQSPRNNMKRRRRMGVKERDRYLNNLINEAARQAG